MDHKRSIEALIGRWPALRARSFRLFIAGQLVSLLGTWIAQVAMSWLVFRLSESAFVLGLFGLIGQLPGIAVAPFAGVLADRADPRRIVLTTQALAMVQALLLAIWVLLGQTDLASLLFLSAVLGAITGFDMPARQVLLAALVERKEDIGNAIAVNSLALDVTRLIGPLLGGILIASFGEGICFLANAASYLPLIAALAVMRLPLRAGSARREPLHKTLAEGVVYAFRVADIRDLLLLVSFASFITTPYSVLMPIMAAGVLQGGPDTFGILTAAMGLGAIAGALFLAAPRRWIRFSVLPLLGAGLFGIGLLTFAISHSVVLSVCLLAVAGFGMMVMMASSNTLLLTLADDEKRGRVMSLFILSFMASVPLGSFFSGIIASMIGASETIALGGGLCVLGTFVFSLKRMRRGSL